MPLPLAAARRIDEACDRFERDAAAGKQPRIGEFVAEVLDPHERAALLRELVALDAERHRANGTPRGASDYLNCFPDHRAVVLEALEASDPEGAGLVARAAGLFARFGPAARSAAKAILGAFLPGTPALVDLVGALFDAADPTTSSVDPTPSTPHSQRRQLGDLLGLLTGELAELVEKVAALNGRADAVAREIEAAMADDGRCRNAVEKLGRIGLAGEARTMGQDTPEYRSGPMVELEVIDGPHKGQRLAYDRHDTLLVGRGCGQQLADSG